MGAHRGGLEVRSPTRRAFFKKSINPGPVRSAGNGVASSTNATTVFPPQRSQRVEAGLAGHGMQGMCFFVKASDGLGSGRRYDRW